MAVQHAVIQSTDSVGVLSVCWGGIVSHSQVGPVQFAVVFCGLNCCLDATRAPDRCLSAWNMLKILGLADAIDD